jgi:hypothetical protein
LNEDLHQRLDVADQRVVELEAESFEALYNAAIDERDALLSELTKARELLGSVYDADLAARHHQPYNVSKVIDDIESFLAHHSAPAAKDGDWSGWATHVEGKLPKLYGDRGIAELNWDKENGADLIKLAVSARVKP